MLEMTSDLGGCNIQKECSYTMALHARSQRQKQVLGSHVKQGMSGCVAWAEESGKGLSLSSVPFWLCDMGK